MDSSRSRVLILDESRHGNVLAVGGYIVTADRLVEIADSWRSLKSETFGVVKGAFIPIVALTRGFPLAPSGWSGTRRLSP